MFAIAITENYPTKSDMTLYTFENKSAACEFINEAWGFTSSTRSDLEELLHGELCSEANGSVETEYKKDRIAYLDSLCSLRFDN